MTKQIQLTKGKTALIDDEDYERASRFKWQAVPNGKNWKARRTVEKAGKCHSLFLHRFVLDAPKGVMVDHINGDGLDNRKCNLRFCTNSQNQHNGQRAINNTSGYKGVSWHIIGKKWVALIQVEGRKIHLGLFETREEAAHAYDDAARHHFGEFARTNF